MNFSNHFCESWNARFSGSSHYPQLDCLKADHFGSLLEQKQAIEFEESRRSAIIDELKQQLNHENFVVEFLHKCVQKLGAVSQVFNEIDQSDSKSTSSSGTTSRRPPSTGSPSPINGSVNNGNKFLPGSNSTFSLFPHCIASSLMQSASPLLAAAAATPSSPFLLSSTLSQFSGSDSMKLDPDTDPANGGRPSNFLLSAATERSSYDALSRLASQSSLYNTNNNNGATTNPFTNGSAFTSHQLRSQGHSIENRSRDDTPFSADYVNSLTSSSEAHAQAAAAVAAAFGLGFPSTVRSRNTSAGHLGMLQKSENESYQTSTSLHSSPPAGLNGRDTDPSVDRPYQCATCFRTFAVKAGLVQHMRTHTDERPYPCSHCGRAFKQKIQLTTHMRVHSGERPYGCRLCGKLFRQQSHVVQHLRTHTGEKPHKCYQCGKAFRQKYSLISHQRRMCRNRAASNPIAAGMTMWISPGAGGDTCNLVKEFSPARGSALTTITNNNNNTASYSSPSNNGNYSIPTPAASTVQSPFSPYMNASPPVNSIGQKIVNNPDRSFPATATSNLPDGLTRVKMDAPPCTPQRQQPEELPTQVDSEIEEDDEESVEDDDDCDDMENPTTQARNLCSSTTRSPRLPPPQNAAPLGLT